MSLCKRIISAFMAVVITFMLFAVPKAEATVIGDAAYAYTQSSFAQWIVGAGLSAAGYYLGGTLGTIALPGVGTVEGTTIGTFLAEGAKLGFDELMAYLAEYPVDDAYAAAEGDYVSTLDTPVVSSGVGLYSKTFSFNYGYISGEYFAGAYDVFPYPDEFFVLGSSYSGSGTRLDVYVYKRNSSNMGCFYLFSEPFSVPGPCTVSYSSYPYPPSMSGFKNCGSCGLMLIKDGTGVGSIQGSSASFVLDSGHTYQLACRFNVYPYTVGDAYLFASDVVLNDLRAAAVSDLPAELGEYSRLSGFMQTINQYNTINNTVNYYIAPSGTEDLYSPALYDEETLVYTDPVTGTEYLTNGWTYDYTTRCYTLDMADETFTIGETVIDTIKLTYGDELLTVDHYASGSLIQSDEYNYMMAAESECSLFGHSYTYETVKEPTCTALGERKYTCSVCGDEYAEDIPATGHTHVFSVLKEATCTAAGIGVYTCSSCGTEYTEPIPMTDHVSTLLETVPSEFDENGVLISVGYSVYECSVCGTQYTVQDEIATDDEGWFSFIVDLLKSFLKTIITTLAAGLSKLFSAMADLISWIFGFLTETVLSGLKGFFDSFSNDSSIFDGFRQENEDGSTTVVLPSGVATVFQFFSGTILLLPDDLRLVLVFGIAALFVIAVFNKRP